MEQSFVRSAELNWNGLKTEKPKRLKQGIELNIDPEVVEELNNSLLGLGISVLLFGGFGVIVGTIILFKKKYISGWINHLKSPNYYPAVQTSDMLKRVKTISSCCSWAIAGNILWGLSDFIQLVSSSNDSDSLAAFLGLAVNVIGLIIGMTLKSKADKVTQSSLSGETHVYNRPILDDTRDYSSSLNNENECTNCGATLKSNEAYCHRCGTRAGLDYDEDDIIKVEIPEDHSVNRVMSRGNYEKTVKRKALKTSRATVSNKGLLECPDCNATIEPNDKHCRNCGAPLDNKYTDDEDI